MIPADAADSIFIPERRVRFYRHPDTNEPDITLVVGIRQAGSTRYVLAQTKPDDRSDLAVVSDSAGLIPVFSTERSAREYMARIFPLNASLDASNPDLQAAFWSDLYQKGGVPIVDLDHVLRWAGDPKPSNIGPLQLALAWEMLSAADAAPVLVPFDPMGMVGLPEKAHSGEDSLVAQVLLAGMKLNGVVWELRRKGAPADAPWPKDLAEFWEPADDALVARIMRVAVPHFASRLSPEAATRDVTATWPTPVPPKLSATFGGAISKDVTLYDPGPELTHADIEDYVRGRLPPEPEQSGLSPAARARYARDRREYEEDLRLYAALWRKWEIEAHRIMRLLIYARNDGDRRAENVVVRIHVPPGVHVVPSGTDRFGPMNPPDMPPTSSYENASTRRSGRFDPQPRASYREKGERSMYNPDERILPDSGGGTIVEQPISSMPAKESLQLRQIMLTFPTWRDVKPFDLDVEMRVGDTTSVSRLHVNATRTAVSR